jgi:glycosyltransferase involved in cell wall biosynthesis
VASGITLRQPAEPLRLAWSGTLLPGKALPLLLQALAVLPAGMEWTLDILGDGPCRTRWQGLSRELGTDGRCRWHGFLPRDRALAMMHEAHLFIITSMKDLTSTVLMEALGQGVPVICPDHCGFPDVVTDACGVKVPVIRPRQVARDMAAAIRALRDDEDRRRRLARGALDRVLDFAWDKKASRIEHIYREAVQRHR